MDLPRGRNWWNWCFGLTADRPTASFKSVAFGVCKADHFRNLKSIADKNASIVICLFGCFMMFLFQSGNMWIFLCDGQPPAGLPSQELGPSRLVPSWFWTGAQRNQIHHDKEDHHHDHQESTGSVCVCRCLWNSYYNHETRNVVHNLYDQRTASAFLLEHVFLCSCRPVKLLATMQLHPWTTPMHFERPMAVHACHWWSPDDQNLPDWTWEIDRHRGYCIIAGDISDVLILLYQLHRMLYHHVT